MSEFSEFIDPLAASRADLDEAVDRHMRLQSRLGDFPLFLHFGNRALKFCKDGGYKQPGRRTVATWISPLIAVENGVHLTIEAVTSHHKTPAESDRGPVMQDVRLPRPAARVYEVTVRSEVEAWRRHRSYGQADNSKYDTFVEIGDREQVRTNIDSLRDNWSAALDYVGESLDASLTCQMPDALREWYKQAMYSSDQ